MTTITAQKTNCSKCSLNALCLPLDLDKDEIIKLETLVKNTKKLKENDILFRQGENLTTLYAVRSGALKSTIIDKKGNETITGFYLPGELIGLNAIYKKSYKTNLIALNTASVCVLPYSELTELSSHMPHLQQKLLSLLSKELNEVNKQRLKFEIEQRLAIFIYNLSTRYKERGYSSTHIHLAMPHQDIANYLSIAPETISRLFKRMQNKHILTLNRRELIIEDMDTLKSLAGCNTVPY